MKRILNIVFATCVALASVAIAASPAKQIWFTPVTSGAPNGQIAMNSAGNLLLSMNVWIVGAGTENVSLTQFPVCDTTNAFTGSFAPLRAYQGATLVGVSQSAWTWASGGCEGFAYWFVNLTNLIIPPTGSVQIDIVGDASSGSSVIWQSHRFGILDMNNVQAGGVTTHMPYTPFSAAMSGDLQMVSAKLTANPSGQGYIKFLATSATGSTSPIGIDSIEVGFYNPDGSNYALPTTNTIKLVDGGGRDVTMSPLNQASVQTLGNKMVWVSNSTNPMTASLGSSILTVVPGTGVPYIARILQVTYHDSVTGMAGIPASGCFAAQLIGPASGYCPVQ